MKMEEIEVVIGSEGDVQLTVRGVEGKSCLKLTEQLEEALGGEVEKRVFTSEYYQQETERVAAPKRLPNRRND